MIRRLLYTINRGLWHKSQGYNKLFEPFNGATAFLGLFTFLSVRFHIDFAWWVYPTLFVSSLFFLGLVGFIAKRLGLFKMDNELSNEQNPQLLSILEQLKRINGK